VVCLLLQKAGMIGGKCLERDEGNKDELLHGDAQAVRESDRAKSDTGDQPASVWLPGAVKDGCPQTFQTSLSHVLSNRQQAMRSSPDAMIVS
jgi:hypothetical protein